MKVLIVYHSTDIGPIEAIFNEIGSKPGIHLRVLGPSRGWNPYRRIWHRTPRYQKAAHYELVSGKIFMEQRNCANPFISGLLREIVNFKPDIIQVMNEITSAVLLQALLIRKIFRPQAKVIFWGAENLLDQKYRRANFIKRACWRYNMRHVDGGGYVNSEGVSQVKDLGFSTDNIVITHWGIKIDQFQRRKVDEFISKFNLEGKFCLGYVGRIDKVKGLSTVLKAMQYLPDNTVFLTLGAGDFEETLKGQADELGLGNRLINFSAVGDFEVGQYLSIFDLLVLPSETTSYWKEQFGRVIAEAMACGVPVVGSDSGAIPEALQGTGYIFREKDSVDLANKISEYMALPQHLKQEKINEGLITAQSHYSTECFAGKWIGLYEKLLAKK